MSTALRKKMHQDLQLAGLSEGTQDVYLRAVRRAAGQSLPEDPNRSTHSWESKRTPNYRRFS